MLEFFGNKGASSRFLTGLFFFTFILFEDCPNLFYLLSFASHLVKFKKQFKIILFGCKHGMWKKVVVKDSRILLSCNYLIVSLGKFDVIKLAYFALKLRFSGKYLC